MKKFLIILLCTLLAGNIQAQKLQNILKNYLENYQREDARITPKSTLKNCEIDDKLQTLRITCAGGFEEQFFTPAIVEKIYKDIRAILPKEYKDYHLLVMTDNRTIDDLVPNFLRTRNKDNHRLWPDFKLPTPWVTNTSRPYAISEGLEGTHLSIWQSHGSYYDKKKETWKWQRPRLFCTCEDLFSQTFVIPYLIPMLENAGAVVYTPRERDWQNHEVIVDNDAPSRNGSYTEMTMLQRHQWHTSDSLGFAQIYDHYTTVDTLVAERQQPTSPFNDGTARYIETTSQTTQASHATWMPDIPQTGRYAVYVSYQSLPHSIDNAHYTVYHQGGTTEFSVNQQMGGGTWVYLGTFNFAAGQHDYGMVVLSNLSNKAGVVTADAVRFGGGMGNVIRPTTTWADDLNSTDATATKRTLVSGPTSQLPRWAEAARYSTQWAGMPDSVYDYYKGNDDYKSDILSRPLATNYMAGGSVYVPSKPGLGVPIELSMALHTDAGYSATDEYIGSLSICTTDFNDGLTDAGISRYASRDLSSMLLQGLHNDLKKYDWSVRKLWDRNYGETRVPQMPSVILEMLSHQNFADVRKGYDPQFKFDLCRSVYKTMVKYLAEMHQRPYTIQPLPVQDFCITLNEKEGRAVLRWEPTEDPTEPTARPTNYIVYTRIGNTEAGFDNGTVVHGTSAEITLVPGKVYSFRVCALNRGGKSFPSETLSACIASKNTGTVLIVNGFTRLSSPAEVNTETRQGFNLDADPGVPYGAFAGYCGRQLAWDKANIGSESTTGLGYSGNELEGHVIMGNTFDYPCLHGQGIAQTQRHSFTSTSLSAFVKAQQSGHNRQLQADQYKMLDIITGVQKQFDPELLPILSAYCQTGGRLFISGANLFKSQALSTRLTKATLLTNISDRQVDHVHGSSVDSPIYRDMNEWSFAVPTPEAITTNHPNAFPMLAYGNEMPAAIAYQGSDYRSIVLGFPFESIVNVQQRNQLMQSVVNFLCQ